MQVDEALSQLGRGLGLKTVVLIGGLSMYPQLKALAQNPHIIIATPGRLNDHLNQKNVRLADAKIVVLDEADRMLDMGFAPQIQKIFQHLPAARQTMLFSATMAPEIIKMASRYMKLPLRIEVAPTGTTAERVTQEIFILPKEAKVQMIEKLLAQYLGPTLIFTRTKYGAKRLNQLIRELGHPCAELHSNRSLSQRQDALQGFKSGKYRVLIATDLASRGIDVIGIELVINFDLPSQAGDYVHRIGRTARAGSGGHAISLVTPDQRGDLKDIERLVRKNLPVSKLPDLPPARVPRFASESRRDRFASAAPNISRHLSGRPRSNRGNRRPGYAAGRPFRRRY
ncbi:MAG: hypothetical protein A2927_00300 [Candidatus Komeilibacteria bacterium RIFCSPLOWO2_01_FULL_45_10]|uniref:DEAD/DEAH box helicase n=1 Tax=Candidatus Komeilibacteria bacterium RIFCSPLOWO2_01_FULL_45_10 TaxID=1798550 RepID=A0A1G2BJW2_9BACT|nr:MAG: hypothetical protein A2927_00300 [Candidatus Komeilibacteria bacterium RIFCSPLOWO2_01_FULL_45_10]